MTLANGIYYDLSWEQYEAIDRARWSHLKLFEFSAAHVRQALLERAEKTDDLICGLASHRFTFEPERARASFSVWDGPTRRGEKWDAFEKRAKDAGLEVLTENMYETAMAISAAARSSPLSAPWLSDGRGEVSVLWTYARPAVDGMPAIKIDCKSRIDFLKDEAIIDLKTTKCAKPEKFLLDSFNYGYAGQAAMYQDAIFAETGKRLPYRIVAIEKKPPYVPVVFRVPEHILRYGRDLYQSYMFQLAQCRSTNIWSGYATEPIDLQLPGWAQPKNDDPTGMGLVLHREEVA